MWGKLCLFCFDLNEARWWGFLNQIYGFHSLYLWFLCTLYSLYNGRKAPPPPPTTLYSLLLMGELRKTAEPGGGWGYKTMTNQGGGGVGWGVYCNGWVNKGNLNKTFAGPAMLCLPSEYWLLSFISKKLFLNAKVLKGYYLLNYSVGKDRYRNKEILENCQRNICTKKIELILKNGFQVLIFKCLKFLDNALNKLKSTFPFCSF